MKIRLNQSHYDCCGKIVAEKGRELDVEKREGFPGIDIYEVNSGELSGYWFTMSFCEVIS